jgi:hypothetical protein
LATYVEPAFGSVPVADVDVAMVMKAIEPLWSTKTETAGRVRGRIEAVLDWAKARGFRDGDNPARWRGHLSNLHPRNRRCGRSDITPPCLTPRLGGLWLTFAPVMASQLARSSW